MNTLSFLNRLIAIIFTVCYAYQILYSPIVWLFCKKRASSDPVPLHRFAALTCARNEAAVIGDLIDSLKAQIYPQEFLSMFVIADNCTDETADIERPTDFVLILNGKDNTRLLVQDRYNPIHANYEEDITGKDPYIDPPARDSAVFENISMVLRDVIGQYQDAATPLKTFESGKLYYGNGNPSASAYDSRADFISNGDDVEIRIPWQLLNFSDPSRMQIHDDYYDGNYGIEAVGIKEMFIGFGGEENTIEMGRLKLKGWENTVSYHERLKEAYQVLKTYWTGKEYE